MALSPLAGKPAPKEMLVDLARLERDYHERQPDLGDPNQLVSFGTSGHRGSPFDGLTVTKGEPTDVTLSLSKREPLRCAAGHRRGISSTLAVRIA